jgi:acetyl esterase
LSGLPPLYLSAAGLDPLRDDTLVLAARLADAGALFRCDHFPGIVHGCLRMTRELDAARRMIAAGGHYVAHHLNEKITGGLQPWNVANSSS